MFSKATFPFRGLCSTAACLVIGLLVVYQFPVLQLQLVQVLPGKLMQGTRSNGGPDICWSQKAHSLLDDNPSPQSEGDAVYVYGRGCRSCFVGELCHFSLRARSERYFDKPRTLWRDLMVLFQGPTVFAAHVIPDELASSPTFLIKYQAWDPGDYSVNIYSDCSGLPGWGASLRNKSSLQPPPPSNGQLVLAVFQMHISAPPPRSSPASTPCEEKRFARWLDVDGDVKWTPYKCAEGYPTKAEEVLPALLRNNIREISFLGDSVNEGVLYHVAWLAGVRDAKLEQHLTKTWTVRDAETNETLLRLNFYSQDGYFLPEFGCFGRGMFTGQQGYDMEDLSRSADVTIINLGSWHSQLCSEQPEKAYAKYMPLFIDAVNWKLGDQKEHRIVFRSTAPTPSTVTGCGPSTVEMFQDHGVTSKRNALIQFFNRFAKPLVDRQGPNWSWYDSWSIEAPFYWDTPVNTYEDLNHYGEPLTNKEGVMVGVNGRIWDAVAFDLVYYLTRLQDL